MAGQGGRKDGQDKAGGGPAAPAPLTGSVGARALPVPGLCPLPARPAPATSGPAPSPAPARRRRRRRCREWQPPVLPAPPRRQSPGPARSPGQRGHGGKDSSTLLCPPCPSSVPPLSLLSPRVSTRCPSSVPSVPPLSPRCPLQGGSVGSANRRLRLRAAERRFLCLGVFFFFLSGWLARLFSLLILAFARARVASFLCKSLPPAPAGLKSCWFGFSPPPVLNQRVRYVITASIAFKHINLIKHWSNHTHASLLNHAAQISTTIEDIKSYLSYQSKLISC